MKKILISIIKYIIDKVKRNHFIQNIFESPFELNKYEKIGVFKDSYGNSYDVLNGLRSKIRPGWENMLKNQKTEIPDSYYIKQKEYGTITVSKIKPTIEALGKTIENSHVLEIGCHSGSASFAMAEVGAKSVVGTEFSGYKVHSVDSKNTLEKSVLIEVNEELKVKRETLSKLYKEGRNVSFVDDDICNSTLLENTFDIIFSWEVLEHIHDTQSAFNSISKLLKPGGITIHEYNPFFCLNGGHSLCTLDFLWGHTRLDEADFSRFLEEFRPNEKEKALSFFNKGLNRMTLVDIREQLEISGLKIHSILPFTKEQHLRMVDKDVLLQSQRHYPNLTLLDLAAPRVLVIAQKQV